MKAQGGQTLYNSVYHNDTLDGHSRNCPSKSYSLHYNEILYSIRLFVRSSPVVTVRQYCAREALQSPHKPLLEDLGFSRPARRASRVATRGASSRSPSSAHSLTSHTACWPRYTLRVLSRQLLLALTLCPAAPRHPHHGRLRWTAPAPR